LLDHSISVNDNTTMTATFKPDESQMVNSGRNNGSLNEFKSRQPILHAKTITSDNFTTAHLLNRGCNKIVRMSNV